MYTYSLLPPVSYSEKSLWLYFQHVLLESNESLSNVRAPSQIPLKFLSTCIECCTCWCALESTSCWWGLVSSTWLQISLPLFVMLLHSAFRLTRAACRSNRAEANGKPYLPIVSLSAHVHRRELWADLCCVWLFIVCGLSETVLFISFCLICLSLGPSEASACGNVDRQYVGSKFVRWRV
jgi:hypothetical protein